MRIGTGFNLTIDNESTYYECETVGLPTIEENTEEFTGGGGVGAIDINVGGFKTLELAIKLKSHNAEIKSKLSLLQSERRIVTLQQQIRDEFSDETSARLVVARGKLLSVKEADLKAASLPDFDYVLKSILYYKEVEAGKLVYEFSIKPPIAKIGDRDLLQRMRQDLGLTI